MQHITTIHAIQHEDTKRYILIPHPNPENPYPQPLAEIDWTDEEKEVANLICSRFNSQPDLLAACRYTLDNLDTAAREKLITAPKHMQAQLGESAKMLRAAIAKAEQGGGG